MGASLDGVVVVVTGASRGIGAATARLLAGRGARVVVNGRDGDAVNDVVAAIREGGGQAVGAVADVREPAEVESLFDAIPGEWGAPSILIANAGVAGPAAATHELAVEAWSEVMDTNVAGVFLAARQFLDRCGRGARLVVVSSSAAAQPPAGSAAYAASKRAAEALAEAVAREHAPAEVAVAIVRPPTADTPMTRARGVDRGVEPSVAAELVASVLAAPPNQIHGRVIESEPQLQRLVPRQTRRRSVEHVALDRAECPWGMSPAARAAIVRAGEDPRLHMYPAEGHPKLVRAIASHCSVAPEHVTYGAGATAIIDRALRTSIRPGESVVTHAPTWTMFERLAVRQGAVLRQVPIAVDPESNRAELVLEPMLDHIDASTKLVYLVSPSNPVGAALDADCFAHFAKRVPASTTIVVDEAYIDFASEARSVLDVAEWNTGPALLVVRTLSKMHGLAGLRVGYGVATESLAARLDAARLPYEVSSVAAEAAVAALGDYTHQLRVRRANTKQRERLGAAFSDQGVGWIQSEANFVLVEHPEPSRFHDACRRRGLLVPRVVVGDYTMFPIGLREQNDQLLEIFLTTRRNR